MKSIFGLIVSLLLITGIAAAQQVTPALPPVSASPTVSTPATTLPPNLTPTTPEIPPVTLFTPTPFAPTLEGTPSLRPITPDPNDARLAACAAPTLDGFAPYIVRAGDRLDALLVGFSTISVTQLAALNCLDDPAHLPPGAVIWLPSSAAVFTASSVSVTEAADAAAITQFDAAGGDSDHGVTLTWAATGEAAYLYPCPSAAQCDRPRAAQPIPLTGSLRVYPFHYAGEYTYRLEVAAGDEAVTQDVTFAITCAQAWLGAIETRACPDAPPLAVMIAYQPFEHGAMIWFSDTLEIYVLTDDGRVSVYEDVFREGAPDPTAAAPDGLLTPVRGFGMIWEFLGGAASPLGWATALEAGFDSARQAAGRTSYTTYILAPNDAIYAITLIPGMERGFWSIVE